MRLGETKAMNHGEVATIIKYYSATKVVIKFEVTGEEVITRYSKFKTGCVKSHFTPSVYGRGIRGLITTEETGKNNKAYRCWFSMLNRCYSEKVHKLYPNYVGCTVCDEWLEFSNFKKYYEENYYEVENQKTTLDKDLLFKGNKIYSPKTSVFVPNSINTILCSCRSKRGINPVGVTQYRDKYKVQCMGESKKIVHLGYFTDKNGAFMAYKKYKEQIIKNLADKYKEQIPQVLYEALYNYKIDIND